MRLMLWFPGAVVAAIAPAFVFADPLNPDVSVVLDGYYKKHDTALSERGKGLGLGHTELSLASPIDDLFEGRLTAALGDHDGSTEIELEEAFLQTTGVPYGLSLRGGRFLSEIGYLNSRHTHADSFVERPAVYRALLGGHYFDDGARINLLMPTPFYWRVGVEVFNGNQLADGEGDKDIGVYTLNTKVGGDISASHSWQAGFSWLRNNVDTVTGDDSSDEHDHEGHTHSASYIGKNLYVTDFVWKWAPNGNAREKQIALSGEYLYAEDLGQYAHSNDSHEGWYVSAVYKFAPQWSTGLRYGEVDLKEAHGDHFHDQALDESELMLAWSRSHFSTIRMQYTHQSAEGFSETDNTITLQYVATFGAHAAHAF